MALSRVHRLLRLISLMQSGRALAADALAHELGVSRRTLFRDLKLLEAAGVPYYHDRSRGYRIADRFFLPPLNLTVTETLGLLLMGESLAADPKRPFARPALSAIAKLLGTVPEPIRSACAEMIDAVEVNPGPTEDGDAEDRFYADLQRCIDESRACRIVYDSLSDPADTVDTTLEPYVLHFSQRAWYVLGRTDLHREVRVLKLNRLRAVEPLPRCFERPAGYRAQDKLGLAWRLIPEGEVHEVELWFTPKVARNAYEVRWHPTQRHEVHDDGSCTMRFRVDGLNEIAWWVCGYADQAEVRQPARLRALVADMLQRAAGRYG